MEKLLLRPGEVCDVTGLGKSKCYELIATGVIPSVRIGRAVRVPAEGLRQWITELQGTADAKNTPKSANPSKNARSSGGVSTEI